MPNFSTHRERDTGITSEHNIMASFLKNFGVGGSDGGGGGGGGMESMIDSCVDKAADLAKEKVKTLIGGDAKKEEKDSNQGGGGLANILSFGDDKKEGDFTDLLPSSGNQEETKGSSGGGLTDALSELAGDMAGGSTTESGGNPIASFGSSLFK